MPAVRQKLHLSPCADFRGRLYVKQIGPTQFEMTISEFTPRKDLAILFLLRQPPYDSGQGTAEPDRSDGAASLANISCEGLWNQRNMIFKAARYCFKTQRAIQEFGNAGCQYDDLTSVPLSEICSAMAM